MLDQKTSASINLSIVVPCFNEEAVLAATNSRLNKILRKMREEELINEKSLICYVDDGSYDGTWIKIQEFVSTHHEVCGIKLSRNRGHQNALLCGLLTVPGEVIISIDADLQDDPDVIPQMVKHYLNGCEIVYGVRKRRDSDTFFKRMTAESFYKLMAIMKVDILFNHADYRLLSRRTLNALSEYRESNLFLRGLVRQIGFKNAIVEYDRAERLEGTSKFPLSRMLSFAWQGVTSFTTAPLSLITAAGVIISFVSIAFTIWGLFVSIFTNKALPGWTSTVVPMYFLGGVQLLSLGVIGEYIAKIYMESKDRPRFHIEELSGTAFKD